VHRAAPRRRAAEHPRQPLTPPAGRAPPPVGGAGAPPVPSTGHPAPDATAGALALRAWGLHLLAGVAPPPAVAARAFAASPPAWDRFLRVERCAAPLHAAADAIPAAAGEVLERHRDAEVKRFLSARAQLLWLGRAVRERGWPVVVLKGGAEAAAGGATLDLADVDLLAPAAMVAPLASLLDASGYAPQGPDAAVGAEGAWHLAQRLAEGAIQVEVHYTVRDLEPVDAAIDRSVPMAGGLRRLAPADELWHLLAHAVVHHPERRGRLRELLLLGRALARAGLDERRAVRARAAAHRHGDAMAEVLEMAGALAAGTVPRDPFRTVAAAAYEASARARPLGSAVLAMDRWEALFASLSGEPRALRTRLGAPAPVASTGRALALLERRAPPVGRGARMLQRLVRLGLGYVLSRPLLWRAKRLTGAEERSEPG
jgi:hypothetical protein